MAILYGRHLVADFVWPTFGGPTFGGPIFGGRLCMADF
jgi:hypothetical protein